ncbi:hypothetical protein [Hamadaea tsunoensis]|uniref:hypothetical protein n=1 Tax=Hamadaea tsunoensis TaxID=53368 RepID=UPI0003FC7A54|nr:hypothetical protein [Hamadaea tsunoensis]
MRYAGFYDALGYTVGTGVEPRSVLGDRIRLIDRDRVVAYLDRGTTLIAVPGPEQDPIGGTQTVDGGSGVRTDGEWAWPTMAAYLVATYDMDLPEEFLARIRAAAYVPPTVEREELIEIFEANRTLLTPRPASADDRVRLDVILVREVTGTGDETLALCGASATGGPITVGAEFIRHGTDERVTVAGVRLRDGMATELADGAKGLVSLSGATAAQIAAGDVFFAAE